MTDETRSEARADAAMDRYAGGQESAFSDLYDLIAPRLHSYLLLKTRDESATEDILQQTFVNIHEARGRFLRGARVMPWAVSIARRLFIDSKRRHKRECPLSDEHAETVAKLVAADAAPDLQLASQRTARQIAEALERLPPRQREAFELVRCMGLSQAQAAEVLGTSALAVKLRIHRASDALRRSLSAVLNARQL
ncbi:MAG TPA: RNA polymerase sigma factor [Polyangiaceae bacterium]